MTTAPDRLLLRLEWRILRRLDGRLQGGYRTVSRGSGFDFAGLRAYTEDDDARRIDWNATARLVDPQLREYTEDRELTAWLVLDRSRSMTADPRKAELLAELALLLTRMLGRNGNRVGAVLYDSGPTVSPGGASGGGPAGASRVRVVRPGAGRVHALRIGRELERGVGSSVEATTDLGDMLGAVAGVARRRSLIVVVSDLIGTGDWERPLLRLSRRHEVAALRVTDPADDALPEVGLVVVEDAETGEQLVVDASDPLFREGFDAAVAERDATLVSGMRRAGVPLHRIGTERDLGDALVEVVTRTRWRRA